MRRIIHILAVCVVALGLPLVLTGGSARLTPLCTELTQTQPFDLAFVLGAGTLPDGRPNRASYDRTDAAVALWQAGLAKQLHFSGASLYPEFPTARAMRDHARSLGVPGPDMSVETKSLSTLQNVANSLPQLDKAPRVILVTSGFHVWRSALTMRAVTRWPDGTCRAVHNPEISDREKLISTALEIPKWWGNALRSALWAACNATGTLRFVPDWVWA